MKTQFLIVMGMVVLPATSVGLVGCSKSNTSPEAPKPVAKEFTPEEFEKIKTGMDDSEVKEILGDPRSTSQDDMGNMYKYWNVRGEKHYAIKFNGGKVVERAVSNVPFPSSQKQK